MRSGFARWLQRGVAALGVVLCVSAWPAAPAAQTKPPAPDAGYEALTVEERDLIKLAEDDKLLTARTGAEALLARDERSIAGHYVMGTVLREAEGALPRALAHLQRARELYEERWSKGETDAPWRLHADILFGTMATAQLMESWDLALQTMEAYDALYSPKLTAQRVWPLMKMGRYDEARRWAQQALDSGSTFQKLRALNGMCAVEAEEKKRVAAYEACLAVYRFAKERRAQSKETDPARIPQIAVYANNAHLGALGVMKYAEAEQLAVEATKSNEISSSNPWLRLARLYLGEGRLAEAVSATKALQVWRSVQPPATREQFRAEDEAAVASLLLIAGETEAARKLADRIMDRPDRRGLTSTQAEQTAGASALLRLEVTRTLAEQLRERASFSGWTKAASLRAEATSLRAAAWADEQRVIAAVIDDARLVATLRVNMAGGLEPLGLWQIGDLVRVLGPGVFLSALDAARRAENENIPCEAFYTAYEAEARLALGEDQTALDLVQRALRELPQAEALLVARTAAVGARAAHRLGRIGEAVELYGRAMGIDAGIVRRLGVALPAEVKAEGGAAAQEAADLLRGSPRLSSEAGAFVVRVHEANAGLEACVTSQDGAQIACARVPLAPPAPRAKAPLVGASAGSASPGQGSGAESAEAPPSAAERLAEAFHRTVFTPPLNLSESDLRSLDGGTTTSRAATRREVEDLVDPPPPSP